MKFLSKVRANPLIIAGACAALGALLLTLYLHRLEREVSGGDAISVLVAIKQLEPGDVLTSEHISVHDVPMAYVESRAIRASERRKVVGLRMGNTVQSQQGLLWTDLAIASDERRDLSALIQPGSRAVSIRAESGDKSFALLRPGDYVDVLSTVDSKKGTHRSAVVLLQRVLVLAVGLQTAKQSLTAGKEQARTRDFLLTLSVRLEDAQLLALARERGPLTLALRSPDDHDVIDAIPSLSASALLDNKVSLNGTRHAPTRPVRLEAKR